MEAHAFLVVLSSVLGVAAVTTVVCQRLHLPVVLGYILAGFILGPHVPIPLIVDRHIVQTLSELGVILIMFSLGLELHLGKIVKLGTTAGIIAVMECSLMLWLGFTVGHFLGWSTIESVFAGSIVAISSTAIITKAFEEYNVKGRLRELVVSVLVVEDLVAIVLMAALTAVSSGSGLSALEMAMVTGKLALFLVGLMTVGLLFVPRAMRMIVQIGRPETTLVASIGLCFGVALLAQTFGYSVALGAFIAGSLIAESGEQHRVAQVVEPVRDMFAAVFFVSVGVLIDPGLILKNWHAVALLSTVVILGKILGVSAGAFLTGNGVRTAIQSGMSLAQIGELSFIIAGLGISLGSVDAFLYPVAVAVSSITTLTTPWLIRLSGPVANFIDRKLPHPLQTFVTLYASWLEKVRSGPPEITRTAMMRRYIRLLLLDLILLAVVAIGTTLAMERLAEFIEGKLHSDITVARIVVIVLALAIGVPLAAGVVRVVRRLSFTIAEIAIPVVHTDMADSAATSRRSLAVTLQFGIVLLAGLPLLVVTQPVVGGIYGSAFFVLLLALLGIAIWRDVSDLEDQVRAGTQTIVATLVTQARKGRPLQKSQGHARSTEALKHVGELLPGLGKPTSVTLTKKSASVGKTLADLNLRGLTGATVLAIARSEKGLLIPTAQEVLLVGDVLALAGTHDAIEVAKHLLLHGSEG